MIKELTKELLKSLRQQGYRSIIALGATNLSEIRESTAPLLVSKEPLDAPRITETSYYISIDQQELIELCNGSDSQILIEIPD